MGVRASCLQYRASDGNASIIFILNIIEAFIRALRSVRTGMSALPVEKLFSSELDTDGFKGNFRYRSVGVSVIEFRPVVVD